MPETTENYHWIPVRDADLFVQNSFRQMTLSEDKGIHARIGKLKSDPDGGTVVQSYYFDKDKWSMDEAKKWVKDHKKSAGQMERRFIEHISRMNYDDSKTPKIEGYGAVFNVRTELWPGFLEEVAPGAFKEAIRSKDIYALFNHDVNNVLGNTGAETLELREDEKGLAYKIIPPETTLGRDVTTLIKRGDIRKSSFGFNIEEEKWTKLGENKGVLRTILKVKPLFDVSPVTFPAYPQTEAHVRMTRFENVFLVEDKVIEVTEPTVDVQPLSDEELFKQFEDLKKKVI